MKKLMLAVAIVSVAVMSQAGSFSWSATKICNASGTSLGADKIGYLLNGDTYAKDTVIAALEGVGGVAANDWLEKATKLSWTTELNTSTGSTKWSNTAYNDASLLGVKSEVATTFVAVIFDTDTVGGASSFYVMTAGATIPNSGNKNIAFGAQDVASSATGAWHKVAAVPEPTSALLMLLGMAGVALKRKQA